MGKKGSEVPPMDRRTRQLEPAQRVDLEEIRNRDPRPYMRERAAALLKIADGLPVPGWRATADSNRTIRPHSPAGSTLPEPPTSPPRTPPAGGGFPPEHPARQPVLEPIHPSPELFGAARSRWTLALLQALCPAFARLRSLAGVW